MLEIELVTLDTLKTEVIFRFDIKVTRINIIIMSLIDTFIDNFKSLQKFKLL
jgi:hypothetical protein